VGVLSSIYFAKPYNKTQSADKNTSTFTHYGTNIAYIAYVVILLILTQPTLLQTTLQTLQHQTENLQVSINKADKH